MHEYASCRSVPGVLAQSEACVLSKDEVLGSKPRYSTVFLLLSVLLVVLGARQKEECLKWGSNPRGQKPSRS